MKFKPGDIIEYNDGLLWLVLKKDSIYYHLLFLYFSTGYNIANSFIKDVELDNILYTDIFRGIVDE